MSVHLSPVSTETVANTTITNPARLLTVAPGRLATQTFPDQYVGPVKQEFIRIDPSQIRDANNELLPAGTLVLRPYRYATRDIKEIDRSRMNFVQKYIAAKVDVAKSALGEVAEKFRAAKDVVTGIPKQTLAQPTYPVRLAWRGWKGFWSESAAFFNTYRSVGRSLPFLVIGSSMMRGCADYAALEIDRYDHMIETPAEVSAAFSHSTFVQMETDATQANHGSTLSWIEAIELIRLYPNDVALVSTAIDGMLAQTDSPEGALVISLILQETILNSPTLGVDEKTFYQGKISEAFEAVTKAKFGITMVALRKSGVLASLDEDLNGIPDKSYNERQQESIASFLKKIKSEKDALILLNENHAEWMSHTLARPMRFTDANDPGDMVVSDDASDKLWEDLKTVRLRGNELKKIPVDWESWRYKLAVLDKSGEYQASVVTSYSLMNEDFSRHNRGYSEVWLDGTTDIDSGLLGIGSSLAGIFYFLPPHGIAGFIVTPMTYGAAGASISAPGQAHDAYLERHAIPLVLPRMVASEK